MKNTVAVVLAGGIGKRFWPIMTPKPLIKMLGKPFVLSNIELLAKIGIKDVILVVPPNTEGFSLPLIPGLTIQKVVQSEAKGVGDAVLQSEKAIGKSSCLIINGDDFVEERLYQDSRKFMLAGKAFFVGKKVNHYFDGGYFKLKDNKITEIIEKPGQGKEPSNVIKLVFDYFPDPAVLFNYLKKTKSSRDDEYERALSNVIAAETIQLLPYEGVWQPLKYPWHILDMMEYFLAKRLTSRRGKGVIIAKNVTISGPVYFGDNVRVLENTKIVGPSYIGENTIIGNNNIIRASHIGSNCVTGFSTDITRSYVGDNCWFHTNYIGDSVLEGNISMGSGAVLANLRLDESDIWTMLNGQRVNTTRNKLGALIGHGVRIGVNASIMPGIKIGHHSFISAGVVLDRDIEENSYCWVKSEITVIKNTRAVQLRSRDEFRKHL